MDGKLIGTLAHHIVESRHRRDRKDNGTIRQPSFDTTVEADLAWDERHRGRDGGCGTDSSGQGRHSI